MYDSSGACVPCRFRFGYVERVGTTTCSNNCNQFCIPIIPPSAPADQVSWTGLDPDSPEIPHYAVITDAVPCSDGELPDGARTAFFVPTELLEQSRPFGLRADKALAEKAAHIDPALTVAMIWLREGKDFVMPVADVAKSDFTVEGYRLTSVPRRKSCDIQRVTESTDQGASRSEWPALCKARNAELSTQTHALRASRKALICGVRALGKAKHSLRALPGSQALSGSLNVTGFAAGYTSEYVNHWFATQHDDPSGQNRDFSLQEAIEGGERYVLTTRFDSKRHPVAIDIQRFYVSADGSEQKLLFEGAVEIDPVPVDHHMVPTSDNYYAPVYEVIGVNY